MRAAAVAIGGTLGVSRAKQLCKTARKVPEKRRRRTRLRLNSRGYKTTRLKARVMPPIRARVHLPWVDLARASSARVGSGKARL